VARTTPGRPPAASGAICTGQEAGLTDWPIERIAEQVQPNDVQQALIDKLKDATARAVSLLQSACPTDLPSTPTGRLAAARQRVEFMLQAVRMIQPTLGDFYHSLTDEQKERFNALDSGEAPVASPNRVEQQPDPAQVCSSRVAAVPTDRIDQVLRLDEAQRDALANLNKASSEAADILSRSCPQETALTPPGRVAAMEQRLDAMLQAVDVVQPALAGFYNSLSDEQKARFNRMQRAA
jgi:ABC-type transporter MlaC component